MSQQILGNIKIEVRPKQMANGNLKQIIATKFVKTAIFDDQLLWPVGISKLVERA